MKTFESGLNVIRGLLGENKLPKQQIMLPQNEGYSSLYKTSGILIGKQATLVNQT